MPAWMSLEYRQIWLNFETYKQKNAKHVPTLLVF